MELASAARTAPPRSDAASAGSAGSDPASPTYGRTPDSLHDPASCVLSTSDVDRLAALLHPDGSMLVGLTTRDTSESFDAVVEAVLPDQPDVWLLCRHVDAESRPTGSSWSIPLSDIDRLHIW